MAPIAAELERERDRRITAEVTLIECVRLLTRDQYETLRTKCGHLDVLGGVSGGSS
jgi:hypothetical protein